MESDAAASGTRTKLFVSLFIAVILFFQISQVLRFDWRAKYLPLPEAGRVAAKAFFRAPSLYPFIDYPMYKWPHHYGDEISFPVFYGITESGEEIAVSLEDIGMNYWVMAKAVMPAVFDDDAAAIDSIFQPVAERRGVRFTAVRCADRPIRVERDRFFPVEEKTIAVIDLTRLESAR